MILLLCGALTPWCADAQPQPVKDAEGNKIGWCGGNEYLWFTVLDQARYKGKINADELALMPIVTTANKRTLDENEARVRLLFTPRLTVRAAVPKSKSIVPATPWQLSPGPAPSESVMMSCAYGTAAAPDLEAQLAIAAKPGTAAVNLTLTLHNRADAARKVHFTPELYTPLRELNNPTVVLPRQITRYQVVNGKVAKINFLRHEATALDGNSQEYWWRKLLDGDNANRTGNPRAEIIDFTDPKLIKPKNFALADLVGGNMLIWDSPTPVAQLALRWQNACLQIAPTWNFEMPPGTTAKLTARVIAVKGVDRFDALEEKCLLAFLPSGDTMRLFLLPFAPLKRVTLDANMTGSNGNVILAQSNELAEMTPFAPGKIGYRIGIPLLSGERYPLRVILNDTASAKRLLEINSLVTP